MTTSTTLSGRTISPRAPERGSFPLDHLGECRDFARAYLRCMKANANVTTQCRPLAKQFLACRMDTGLMAREEWAALGFHEDDDALPVADEPAPRREAAGFVAGVRFPEERRRRREQQQQQRQQQQQEQRQQPKQQP